MKKMTVLKKDSHSINQLYRALTGEKKVLLESYDNNTSKGRFSIIARNPLHELKVYQKNFYFDGVKV